MRNNGTRNVMLYSYESPRMDRGWPVILLLAVLAFSSLALSSCQSGKQQSWDMAMVGGHEIN